MPNLQLTLSSSPPSFTGSSLVPRRVSKSMTSQAENSSINTKSRRKSPPQLRRRRDPERPQSSQPLSVALPSSGPRTNNTSTLVSPTVPSESSPLLTPTNENDMATTLAVPLTVSF